MWNLLDYAAMTVPVAKADRTLDAVGSGRNAEWEGHQARNRSDAFNHSQCACRNDKLLEKATRFKVDIPC